MKKLEVYFSPAVRRKPHSEQYKPLLHVHNELRIGWTPRHNAKYAKPNDAEGVGLSADYSCFREDLEARTLCNAINELSGYCAKVVDV